MGVTNLWKLLIQVECPGQVCHWDDMAGLTLAVDSSIWLMEATQVPVPKPHIRNTISRILALLRHGVRLVFVFEGKQKELKAATLAKRSKSPVKAAKSHFSPLDSKISDVAQLLDLFGIPYVRSDGEAEALCGHLNEMGLVDGVITNDSDAFLFGATKVFKNVTGNRVKESEQRLYTMESIQQSLETGREGLVALALLTGCDFTSGSQGVGIQRAQKLLKHWGPDTDPIQRLLAWRNDLELQEMENFLALRRPQHCRKCGCYSELQHACRGRNAKVTNCSCDWHTKKEKADKLKIELDVRKKALADKDFPNRKIIDAFLHQKSEPSYSFKWKEPQWQKLSSYCAEHLGSGWQFDKGRQKLHSLVTAWTLIASNEVSSLAHPVKIVKECIQSGRNMFEVWWETTASFPSCLLPSGEKGFLTTESQIVMQKNYSCLVNSYRREKDLQRKATPIKRRKRLQPDANQPLITNMLKVRKKMRFTPCNTPPDTPTRSSESPLPQMINIDSDDEFQSFLASKN